MVHFHQEDLFLQAVLCYHPFQEDLTIQLHLLIHEDLQVHLDQVIRQDLGVRVGRCPLYYP